MSTRYKRNKTKYPGVYQNDTTKLYDIKFNYTVYDPITDKNKYKARWKYGFESLAAARSALTEMQDGKEAPDEKDITLEGAFELWKNKARIKNYSPVTIKNTEQQLNMIFRFIDKDLRVKDITESIYEKFASDCREHGYSDETMSSINATFRKLINLCYQKKLINSNPLDFCDNIRTLQKDEYHLISNDDFLLIDNYFKTHRSQRLGINNYPRYRLLFSLLYYTGMRIGEATGLTYKDFVEFSYYKKGEKKPLRLVPSSSDTEKGHLQGMRVSITKSYLDDFKVLTTHPKNFKKRSIPLAPDPERLFCRIKEEHKLAGGNMSDRVFPMGHGACNSMLHKACDELGLPSYHCHDFRHTFISNMVKHNVPLPVIEKVSGDTQETILKRYSHMFETDEVLILKALQDL